MVIPNSIGDQRGMVKKMTQQADGSKQPVKKFFMDSVFTFTLRYGCIDGIGLNDINPSSASNR